MIIFAKYGRLGVLHDHIDQILEYGRLEVPHDHIHLELGKLEVHHGHIDQIWY